MISEEIEFVRDFDAYRSSFSGMNIHVSTPTMDIFTPTGSLVRFAFPHFGWRGDSIDGLRYGQIYAVEDVQIGNSSSLVKVNGAWYNTVMFENEID